MGLKCAHLDITLSSAIFISYIVHLRFHLKINLSRKITHTPSREARRGEQEILPPKVAKDMRNI